MSKEQPVVKKTTSPVMKTLKWIAVVTISLLLVLYFIFSGISTPESSILVGKVNNKPIYYSRDSAYAQNYQRISDNLNLQSYNAETRELFSEIIEYQAFTMTANGMLMYDLAKKNIEISDDYVVNNIKSYFIGNYGQFMEDEYKNFLTSKSAVEKKVIEQDIRENISVQTLSHELFQTVKTSSKLIEAEFIKRNNKRSVEVIYADAMPTLRDTVPTEAELRMYFSEHSGNFVQADISWIVTSSTSEATLIYDTLKSDISYFSQMAMDKSEDEGSKASGGKVGKMTRHEMPSPLMAETVFSTSATEVLLEPIAFEGYYYIILLHSIETPSSMEMVADGVVAEQYLYNYSGALLTKIKSDLEEQLAADYANGSALGNTYSSYTINDYHYGSTAVDTASTMNIPFSGEKVFSDAVFTTAVGSSSSVIELPEGVAIVKVIAEHKPSTVASADATDEERQAIEFGMYEATRDIVTQKMNTLARRWADIAFSSAKVEYKLKK